MLDDDCGPEVPDDDGAYDDEGILGESLEDELGGDGSLLGVGDIVVEGVVDVV